MSLLPVENAAVVVTMDGERREIADGAVLIDGQWIERVGGSDQIRRELERKGIVPERRIDAGGCALIPGLDLAALVREHNRQAARLLARAAANGNHHDQENP